MMATVDISPQEPMKEWRVLNMPPSTKTKLIAQKRNLCNIRAEFDRDIAKMQAHRAAIDAGIQALEAQINQMIDKPMDGTNENNH